MNKDETTKAAFAVILSAAKDLARSFRASGWGWLWRAEDRARSFTAAQRVLRLRLRMAAAATSVQDDGASVTLSVLYAHFRLTTVEVISQMVFRGILPRRGWVGVGAESAEADQPRAAPWGSGLG